MRRWELPNDRDLQTERACPWTDEGLVAHMEIAGLVMFVAGAAEAPREGNASSEAVSTVLEAP
jgi:hypothetical protein